MLYANDEKATVDFLLTGEPLTLKTLAANRDFVTAILELEPGPPVDYKELPLQVRNFRQLKQSTAEFSKSGLDDYFDELLTIHDGWHTAAVSLHSYELYHDMVLGLFVNNTDPELIGLTKNMSHDARTLMHRTALRLNQPAARHELEDELHRRRSNHAYLLSKLKRFKKEEILLPRMKKLHDAMSLLDRNLKEQRMKRERLAQASLFTRQRTKARMLEDISNQFGMLGSQDMDQDVEDVVLAVHKRMTKDFLPKFDQKAWEKEKREYKAQLKKYPALTGFEIGFDMMGKEKGVGSNARLGVSYGKSRAEM
jgi:hypothetical protein